MTDVHVLTGRRFGRWLVTGFSHVGLHSERYWLCVCDCGTTRPVPGSRLRDGRCTMCGDCAYEKRWGRKKTEKAEPRHAASGYAQVDGCTYDPSGTKRNERPGGHECHSM